MQTIWTRQRFFSLFVISILTLTSVGYETPSVMAAGVSQSLEGDAPSGRGRLKILRSKIEEVYLNLLPPIAQEIISGERSVDHLFSMDVRGRVTPLGQFPGFESAREYFYGLVTTPGLVVLGVTFKSLVAEGDLVSVEVDLDFDGTATPVGRNYTLTQTGFFTFDENDLITSFDLTLLNLGAAIDPRSPAEKSFRLFGVCALLTLGGPEGAPPSCPDEFDGDQNSEKFGDCIRFMLGLPYGSYNRANSNTFVCRELHSLLTPVRPDIHCPHVGKSGGMTCIDFTYESYYDEDF